jgi:uncharacterized membrane protein
MDLLLHLIVLMFAALATGGLVVNWIGLARAMARINSPQAYTEFHQATNHTFEPYMPIVVGGSILGGIILAITSPGLGSVSGNLAIFGAIGYAAVIAITLPTNLRINKIIARWPTDSPPADWKTLRARWIRFHIIRTLVSLPALASYILCCLLEST